MDTQAAGRLAAIRQHDPALDEVALVAETRRIVAGDTRNSLLFTNENPQASTTVVVRADGSGSVTFTHLDDPFGPGKPNEFADGGYSWTCSQKS